MMQLCNATASDSEGWPVSIRPQYALQWSAQSCDVQQCAEAALADGGHGGVAAIVSGCGQDAAEVALAAFRQLERRLSAKQAQSLTSDDLTAAFQQCHAQLLQLASQQPQQHQQQLNISHSGASCLLVCIDQANKQVLAASAGLCHAVMARAASGGALTVLELSPRLALGYNVAETSRLDAEGSSICYSCRMLSLWAPQAQDQQDSKAAPAAQQQQQQATCPEPVLIGPNGQPLVGVGASRLLGYSSATSAGVIATPVVTSWRLTGEEAFVVLGSPGLWAAMNPAEVVDYVAAALASGACSMQQAEAACDSSAAAKAAAWATPEQEPPQQQGPAELRPDAAVLLSDLLTLEAQERLKLRLADISTLLALGGAAGAGSSTQQVVPDVTAVVVLLPAPVPAQKVPVAQQLLQEQLSTVTRGCRSNAEAHALQARWYSSAGASTCSSSASMVAISSSCSTSSTSIAAPTSMSSSADSSCSTGNSGALSPAAINSSSAAMAAFTGMRAKGRQSTAGTCPAQSPPRPALSCLLPALTVAGHCWPSTFWPDASAAVKVPAALLSRKGSAAAPLAESTDATPEGMPASAGTAAAARPIFALSPRLSIGLDVTYRLGSSGSIGSLAAQCAAADAAADAVTAGNRTLDQLPSPTAAEDQAVIVHKVHLSGPNELESLLFGSATTSHPDTTVARIMKAKLSSSSNHAGIGSMNTLAHAYSWAAPGGFNTSGFGCYSTSTNTSVRQQQRVNGWTTGGWAVAGMQHHHAPRRSASVNIALLSRQLHGSGSCSSSAASSQQSHGSLKVAAGSSGSQLGRDSLAGASQSQRNSLEGMPPVPNRPASAAAGSFVQWQQLGRVPEGSAQPALVSQAASMPAGIPTAGRVAKARSHQALSALQAAGSAELADALVAAAAAQSTAAAAGRSFPGSGVMAAASADAAGLLGSRSSGSGGGLYPHAQQQQLHFRPAFRSALHTTDAGAPAALQNRHSDSAVLASEQLLWQQRLPRLSADAAGLQRTPSIHAQASLADSLASCDALADQDCSKEGKVHGGLARSNSNILLALSAAGAAQTGSAGMSALQQALHSAAPDCNPKAAQRLAAPSSSSSTCSGGTPAARVTFAPSDHARDEEQQGARSILASGPPTAAGGSNKPLEKCVRGGHTKLARLKHSMSSPELKSLASPSSKTRARRASVVLPPYSSNNKQQQQQLGGLARTGGSWQEDSAVGASSSLLVSTLASGSMNDSEPSFSGLLAQVPQQQQQPVTFASAFAKASACSLSPAGSRELIEGSFCADGAVHGGELGEQALEGQMHGGRRSKSMSVGSLLLTSSLPSSAEEHGETLTASLHPGSSQQQPQTHAHPLLRASNSYNTLSCSSDSWRQQLQLSPASPGALPLAAGVSLGASASACAALAAAAASAGTGAAHTGTYGACSRSGSLSGAALGGLQAFASADGPLQGAFLSITTERAQTGGSIEIKRMRSGSFTKVRYTASAPAGAAGEQLSSVVDAITEGPGSVLAGSVQHSAAAGFMQGEYSNHSQSGGSSARAVAAGAVSSSGSLGGAAVKGWSSPGRHVVAFSSSAGSPEGIALRSSSSMPGTGSGLNSPLPAAPRPAWSSSKAWSGRSAAKKLSSSSLFARTAVSAPGTDALSPSGAATAGGSSGSFGAQLLQAAGASNSAGNAGSSLCANEQGGTGGGDDAAASTVDALLNSAPNTMRQRSVPLPTLQESPCCTPGSSPAVSFGFVAAYEETIARHLGALQQQQQSSRLQSEDHSKLVVLAPDGHESEEELTVGSAVWSSLDLCKPLQQQLQQQQQGSFAEHSATGLVMQSLTAEASRGSMDDSRSCSRSTAGCSSEGLAGDSLPAAMHSDSFEFSRPQGGDAWDHSPLLGNILQG